MQRADGGETPRDSQEAPQPTSQNAGQAAPVLVAAGLSPCPPSSIACHDQLKRCWLQPRFNCWLSFQVENIYYFFSAVANARRRLSKVENINARLFKVRLDHEATQ